ncbi:MAG: hypothetical protein RMK91_09155 [Pseudanabaenaceae cyanobacterium SKYGB_i_bin29]|nr:hypothetical protein [Pseudanabaenaceae cyanobacterium SKYG29]MDW8422022.1 hypothetical protein [Pseudanabaenaceae cyanobacterium SKYGB_i_bin29]
MRWKLANPLEYPLVVLAAGILLVLGGRFGRIPPVVMIPIAALVATGGAGFLKAREPERLNLGDPKLEQEVMAIKRSAVALVQRAESMRREAATLLTEPDQIDLLVAIQAACDRVMELPYKIDEIARRLGKNEVMLSVAEIEEQLRQVIAKQNTVTSEAGRAKLASLERTLRHNLELAREGQDSRQIQIANLMEWVTESGGLLQKMQNKIRTIGTKSTSELLELRELSDQLNSCQENVTMLMN